MSSFSINSFNKILKSYSGEKISNVLVFRDIYLSNKYALTYPTNTLNSYKNGNRFNYPNTFPALYFGFSIVSSAMEIASRTNPLRTVFIDSDFRGTINFPLLVKGNFVDLRDPIFCFDPKCPEYQIETSVWESAISNKKLAITHEIGQAIYNQGFDGIIYHSFQAFKRNFHGVIEEERLCGCIFMSTTDFSKPKNTGCNLICFDESLFDQLSKYTTKKP